MRQDTKEKNKQLREQKQELKTQTKNTRTKITPQQAYEMQQSSSSLKAKMIFKSEKEKVKEFKQHERKFIVRQEGRSAVCKLDLSNFPKELEVLSSGPDKTAFVENLIELVGDKPEAWLPYLWGEKSLQGDKELPLA